MEKRMTRRRVANGSLVIKALRDAGYKNAAYAIAELIDNSIQANATSVELWCIEKLQETGTQQRSRIDEIAILDNGEGMDKSILEIALEFSNGTRLDRENRTGMGRFGMGLPSSTVSQARRADVWSWKNGVESALHTYLDVDDVIGGEEFLPEPTEKKIPPEWLKRFKGTGKTGTLVVWSKIDKCQWKTGKSIINNSEQIIARMYRKFLSESKVKIRLACIGEKDLEPSIDRKAKPNDPLYLMSNTSTPEPWDKEPMFEPYPASGAHETKFPVSLGSEVHEIVVRCSVVQKSARAGGIAGNTLYGQHAAKNVGVSIVRAGRELDLDSNWIKRTDPRNRWWGLEIEFPPALDEIFGVTNNKQSATRFSEIARTDFDEMAKAENMSITALKDELKREGDPNAYLIDIASFIRNQIDRMFEIIDAQLKNSRSEQRRHTNGQEDAEKEATKKTRERQETDGTTGVSDEGEKKSPDDRKRDLVDGLSRSGLDDDDAREKADRIINDGLKYSFTQASIDNPSFFSVQPLGGVLNIILNTNHPAYSRLVDVLDVQPDEVTNTSLEDRLRAARTGLYVLLAAWARYEDEQNQTKREIAQEIRTDWGRIARRFLKQEDE